MTAPTSILSAANYGPNAGSTEHEPDPLDDTVDNEDQEQETPGDPSGQQRGWWLDNPDAKQVKAHAIEYCQRQKGPKALRLAREDRWERLRQGERNLNLVASDNDDIFVRANFSDEGVIIGPNTADQLIRRTASLLTTDEPVAVVTANADDPDEREASELAQRIARAEGSPSKRDYPGFLRDMIDLAGTYGTVFSYTYVHPQGGGLKPVEIQAAKNATTIHDALAPLGPPTVGANGEQIPGEPVPADPAELIKRYVKVGGALTDQIGEAMLAWQPAIMQEIVRPAQVWLFPFGKTSYTATGCAVGMLMPLSDVIARFYNGERPDEKTCRELVSGKFEGLNVEKWVPSALRAYSDQTELVRPGQDRLLSPSSLCPILCFHLLSQDEAPLGAYLVLGGPAEPIMREEFRAPVGDGPDAVKEMLSMPLVGLTWRGDHTGDPLGVPGIEDLAPESNIAATILELILDYCERAGRPHAFLPYMTNIQPEEYNNRGGGPITLVEGGQPFFEEIPPLPQAILDMYEKNNSGLEKTSGLNSAAATGEAPASINSGTQLQQVIEETRIGLTGTKQNAGKAYVGTVRNLLTWMRCFIKTAQLLKDTGESGDVQVKSWTGIDMQGAGDIEIEEGTFTMLSQSTKNQMSRDELELALKINDQQAVRRYHRQLQANQGPLVGLEDNAHQARIARQLQQWREAAKKTDYEAAPPVDPMAPPPMDPATGQPAVDPATGQPLPPPAPPDPVMQQLQQIFLPNPTDEEPLVAPMRFDDLSTAMASLAYLNADPRVQQVLEAEYLRMRQASGILTLQEQQQQQAQQAQQQAQIAAVTSNREQQNKLALAEANNEFKHKAGAVPMPGVPPQDAPPGAGPPPA